MKTLLALLMLLYSLSATAQLRFADGVIINNEGDTIKGFIGQREISMNPAMITFKASMTAEEETYTVEDIRYFSVPALGSFERFTLPISMDPVDLDAVQGYSTPPFNNDEYSDLYPNHRATRKLTK